jgi:hypothetical protein
MSSRSAGAILRSSRARTGEAGRCGAGAAPVEDDGAVDDDGVADDDGVMDHLGWGVGCDLER